MTEDETTTEQLAEIEGQAAEYTPPDGWRVLQHGEVLQGGDEWVSWEGTVSRPDIQHGDGATVSGGRYIRKIEGQAEPVQVREGRWRTRGGEEIPVTAMPTDHDDFAYAYPWWDGDVKTWANNGAFYKDGTAAEDLVEYLGPIESQPQQVNDWPSVRDLRHELKTVQTQLGESRQRVTQLEELVASLRTINRGCENAVREAGKMNTALRNQLAAVKAELANVAADRQQLRVELDAAQQVPADSPELRQLRVDLAEVTQDRDTYRDGYDRVLSDLRTIRETTAADTVETIVEWLQAFRGCNSPALASLLLEAMPSIMRSLTGLDREEIE